MEPGAGGRQRLQRFRAAQVYIIHKVAPRYWRWWRCVVGNAFRLKRSYSTPGPVSTAMVTTERNCYRLSRVSWALAQISCSLNVTNLTFTVYPYSLSGLLPVSLGAERIFCRVSPASSWNCVGVSPGSGLADRNRFLNPSADSWGQIFETFLRHFPKIFLCQMI